MTFSANIDLFWRRSSAKRLAAVVVSASGDERRRSDVGGGSRTGTSGHLFLAAGRRRRLPDRPLRRRTTDLGRRRDSRRSRPPRPRRARTGRRRRRSRTATCRTDPTRCCAEHGLSTTPANNKSSTKSFGKSCVATTHGREWTRPLCALVVQCHCSPCHTLLHPHRMCHNLPIR